MPKGIKSTLTPYMDGGKGCFFMTSETMVYALSTDVLLTFQTIDQFIYTKRVARVSPRTLFIYTHWTVLS